MTLIDFLKARIAEDEARATAPQVTAGRRSVAVLRLASTRDKREAAAKRAILDLDSLEWTGDYAAGFGDAHTASLRRLAEVYSDHADYNAEWASG